MNNILNNQRFAHKKAIATSVTTFKKRLVNLRVGNDKIKEFESTSVCLDDYPALNLRYPSLQCLTA